MSFAKGSRFCIEVLLLLLTCEILTVCSREQKINVYPTKIRLRRQCSILDPTDYSPCTRENELKATKDFKTYKECIKTNGTFNIISKKCPCNHYFDKKEKRCIPTKGGGDIMYVDYCGKCKDSFVGTLVHPTQSQFYYICKGCSVIVMKCPRLKIYDPEIQECVDVKDPITLTIHDDSKGIIDPPDCNISGRFPIKFHPDYFYMCTEDGDKFYRSIFKCPSGTQYDPETQMCSLQYAGSTTPKSLNWYLEKDPYPPCQEPGKFRSPKNCSMYYICSAKHQGGFHQLRLSCPSGYYFCTENLQCRPKADVVCKMENICEEVTKCGCSTPSTQVIEFSTTGTVSKSFPASKDQILEKTTTPIQGASESTTIFFQNKFNDELVSQTEPNLPTKQGNNTTLRSYTEGENTSSYSTPSSAIDSSTKPMDTTDVTEKIDIGETSGTDSTSSARKTTDSISKTTTESSTKITSEAITKPTDIIGARDTGDTSGTDSTSTASGTTESISKTTREHTTGMTSEGSTKPTDITGDTSGTDSSSTGSAATESISKTTCDHTTEMTSEGSTKPTDTTGETNTGDTSGTDSSSTASGTTESFSKTTREHTTEMTSEGSTKPTDITGDTSGTDSSSTGSGATESISKTTCDHTTEMTSEGSTKPTDTTGETNTGDTSGTDSSSTASGTTESFSKTTREHTTEMTSEGSTKPTDITGDTSGTDSSSTGSAATESISKTTCDHTTEMTSEGSTKPTYTTGDTSGTDSSSTASGTTESFSKTTREHTTEMTSEGSTKPTDITGDTLGTDSSSTASGSTETFSKSTCEHSTELTFEGSTQPTDTTGETNTGDTSGTGSSSTASGTTESFSKTTREHTTEMTSEGSTKPTDITEDTSGTDSSSTGSAATESISKTTSDHTTEMTSEGSTKPTDTTGETNTGDTLGTDSSSTASGSTETFSKSTCEHSTELTFEGSTQPTDTTGETNTGDTSGTESSTQSMNSTTVTEFPDSTTEFISLRPITVTDGGFTHTLTPYVMDSVTVTTGECGLESSTIAYDENEKPICTSQGVFSLNGSCTQYYICELRENNTLEAVVYQCPRCLRFNEEKGYCDLPVNVPRCLPKRMKDYLKCDEEGTFPIHGECDKYKVCVTNKYKELEMKIVSCPNGMNFNNVTKKCDNNFKCIDLRPHPKCVKAGYFPDEEKCNEFYHCIDKSTSKDAEKQFDFARYKCPYGMVFNDRKGYCDLPSNVPWCTHIDI